MDIQVCGNDCSCDYLNVAGQRYCGRTSVSPQNVVMEAGDTFNFYSDETTSHGGFTVCITNEEHFGNFWLPPSVAPNLAPSAPSAAPTPAPSIGVGTDQNSSGASVIRKAVSAVYATVLGVAYVLA